MQGWLRVDSDDLGTKRQLAKWVGLGTAYARSLPAKVGGETTIARSPQDIAVNPRSHSVANRATEQTTVLLFA